MLMRWMTIGFGLVLTGCSSFLEDVAQVPSPDIAKAIATIKATGSQYHLTGQLLIAGPMEAPTVSLVPWVICLRAASESRFTVALFYKADELVLSRESTISDGCDSQTYRPLPN
jgi:hypothetical protein